MLCFDRKLPKPARYAPSWTWEMVKLANSTETNKILKDGKYRVEIPELNEVPTSREGLETVFEQEE